jgi:hypothetical protein
MRKVTRILWASAMVFVMGSASVSAQDFCINTTLQGGGSRNFRATLQSTVGNTAAITVIDTASVNAIGFGAFNYNPNFLAQVTLAWTVIADGTTENYDCRLFLPSLSGVGNLLTVRNTGNTRLQLSPCVVVPCP